MCIALAALAEGDRTTARRHLQLCEATHYFEAVLSLKVPYFIEHHLATAELEKLRRHNTTNGTAAAVP